MHTFGSLGEGSSHSQVTQDSKATGASGGVGINIEEILRTELDQKVSELKKMIKDSHESAEGLLCIYIYIYIRVNQGLFGLLGKGY